MGRSTKIDLDKELKECSKCQKMLAFSAFGKKTNIKSGLASMCLVCKQLSSGHTRRVPVKVDMDLELKECRACRELLPFSSFGMDKSTKLGLTTRCRTCISLASGYNPELSKSRTKIDLDKELKECSKCQKMLAFSEFHEDNHGNGGLKSACRVCLSKSDNPKRKSEIHTKIDLDKDLKECSECKKMLAFSEFSPLVNGKGGLNSRCRPCANTEGKKSKNKHKAKNKKKRAHRILTDPNYRLAIILRHRLNTALKRNFKSGSAVDALGCSVEYFKKYLEERFYDRDNGETMTWEKHGKYGFHIDHIKPLSSFDLTDRAQLLEACHYTNQQPLWAEHNLAKGAKETWHLNR